MPPSQDGFHPLIARFHFHAPQADPIGIRLYPRFRQGSAKAGKPFPGGGHGDIPAYKGNPFKSVGKQSPGKLEASPLVVRYDGVQIGPFHGTVHQDQGHALIKNRLKMIYPGNRRE